LKVCLECEASFESEGWRCPECGYAPAANGFLRFALTGAEEAFPEESFESLPAQEEASFWFRARNELIAWALKSYFPSAHSFFELGCGTGVVLTFLRNRCPQLALGGGEPFAAGLGVARARLPDVPLYQLDGRALPFAGEFDVIGAFDVLEHVVEDEVVLEQMHQATRPNGGILVSVPQHQWLWSAVDSFSRHQRRYAAGELVAKIENAGFAVMRKTSFVTLLLPAVAFSRWRHRSTQCYDPATEFRLHRIVEALFRAAMTAERSLITRGLSFPAGSSLLVVARRV
jgi:SAM-dependent methyltransferase